MLARLARVVLVVALLAGWQAALQHPIAHVDELGALVHLHSGDSHEDDTGAGSLCDLLAALTACTAGAPAALAEFFSDYAVPTVPAFTPRAAQAPPFLSQGPPRSA